LYGAETWTFWKLDQKYLESFAMWCSIRMEKISYTDRVRNEKVLQRVEEDMTFLQTIQRNKPKGIGHILAGRAFKNTLLKEG
jgi:hypothetical protein